MANLALALIIVVALVALSPPGDGWRAPDYYPDIAHPSGARLPDAKPLPRVSLSPPPSEPPSGSERRPKDGGDTPASEAGRGSCEPLETPVEWRALAGATMGEASKDSDGCLIRLDPSIKAQGEERVCTVLAHERRHIAGEWGHVDSGLMRATLPDDYIYPPCLNAVSKANDAPGSNAVVKEDGAVRMGYGQ